MNLCKIVLCKGGGNSCNKNSSKVSWLKDGGFWSKTNHVWPSMFCSNQIVIVSASSYLCHFTKVYPWFFREQVNSIITKQVRFKTTEFLKISPGMEVPSAAQGLWFQQSLCLLLEEHMTMLGDAQLLWWHFPRRNWPRPSLDSLTIQGSWNLQRMECKFFFLFCLFRAAPAAYGSFQVRARIRAAAAVLYHSHSKARSKPYMRPMYAAVHGQHWIVYPTERGQGWNPQPHGY